MVWILVPLADRLRMFPPSCVSANAFARPARRLHASCIGHHLSSVGHEHRDDILAGANHMDELAMAVFGITEGIADHKDHNLPAFMSIASSVRYKQQTLQELRIAT